MLEKIPNAAQKKFPAIMKEDQHNTKVTVFLKSK